MPPKAKQNDMIAKPELALQVFKLNNTAIVPSRATVGSACLDLHANIQHETSVQSYTDGNVRIVTPTFFPDSVPNIILPPRSRTLVPTGLILGIPQGYCVLVFPRSGISLKQGITSNNAVGVIDSDYVEELFVSVYNNSSVRVSIGHGDRIAQFMLQKVEDFAVVETQMRPVSETRQGGFGSTGG